MPLIDKALDAILAVTGGWRSLYAMVASPFAVCVVFDWLGVLGQSMRSGDGRAIALGDGPLIVAYRLLDFFGVPNGWVLDVGGYLSAETERSNVIALVATILVLVMSFALSPGATAGSVQASTWWVVVAVAMQCNDGFSWTLAPIALVPMIWAAIRGAGWAIKDWGGLFGMYVVDLVGAAFGLLLPVLALAQDRHTPRHEVSQ